MTAANTLLKQHIADAKATERRDGLLAAYFRQHLRSLHSSVAIHSDTPETGLMQFAFDYIEAVPDHLQALDNLAAEAGISTYVQPFLRLAYTYFTQPPAVLNMHTGLFGALCKAYLVHRLMEEVNDQVMNRGGAALAPMDMSTANIICHELIRDELANQLDHLVLLTLETTYTDTTIFSNEAVKQFMALRRFTGWEEVLARWPCFAKDCGVDLHIGDHS